MLTTYKLTPVLEVTVNGKPVAHTSGWGTRSKLSMLAYGYYDTTPPLFLLLNLLDKLGLEI